MSNAGYQDDSEKNDEQESASLEGKGWDVLAGGRDNPFKLGGDDPFDLKSTSNPNPYTDDDEADWILTSGVKPEAQPDEGTPRDLSPEELGTMAPDLGSAASPPGPITAPTYLFPGGDQGEPAAPSSGPGSMAGLSYGVSVTPVGPEGEPPLTPPPSDLPPISAVPEAHPRSSVVVEAPGGISPGVSVTPVEPEAQPIPSVSMPPSTSPTAPDTTMLGGGPIELPVVPVTPSTPMPSVPATPPWDLPQQPQGLMPPDFVRDPFLSPPQTAQPVGDELEPEEGLASMLITSDRVNALWEEINETYNLVVSDVRGHFETTEQSIQDLKRARELLLAGPRYYDNSEQLVIEVKARLRLEEKVRQWSRSRGTWLAVYLIVWLLLLSAGSLLTNTVDEITHPFVPEWLAATWLPGLFGGLGGVLGALWILVKHIAVKRDFDPIHTPWYVTNPFMGVGMGVVTYFVVLVGGNTFLNMADISGDIGTFLQAKPYLYLFCIIIGFNQNVLWALIDRFLDTVFPQPKEDETAVTEMTRSESETLISGPRG
jgi:hypothetical protein